MGWFKNGGRRRARPAGASDEPLEIGWLINPGEATFIYEAPRPVSAARAREGSGGAVTQDGPAIYFEVPCPFDLRLRIGVDGNGRPGLVDAAARPSEQSRNVLTSQVKLMGQDRWRDPKRPLIQVGAPWRFLADETAYMTQLPALGHYREPPLPGLMIGGRFPVHVWPRSMMWAFDWWDTSKELVLRRGEPWFYLRFETERPERPIRVVEAEWTPELRAYCKGLDGVTNYVSQTFRLFKTAQERRPKTLLKRKERV